MEIDSKGNVVSHEIFESVIKSNIQMTYKKVNKWLETTSGISFNSSNTSSGNLGENICL